MQKYGIIENGELKLVPKGTSGAKSIKWDELPEYDQETQAIFERPPVDKGDYIWIGLEIAEVDQENGDEDEMF